MNIYIYLICVCVDVLYRYLCFTTPPEIRHTLMNVTVLYNNHIIIISHGAVARIRTKTYVKSHPPSQPR